MADYEDARSSWTIPLIPARDISNSASAVRKKTLTRVTRGVYAPAREWNDLKPWEKYGARVKAAAQRHPDAVFFLESAVDVHDLPIFGDPRDVHVLGGDDVRSRTSGGVHVHTTVERRDLVVVQGVIVTSVADTVVDIARTRHPAVALAVADAALRKNPELSVELLVAVNEQRSSSRGRRRARWVLHRATGLAETALESVDRAVIEWLGFPEPQLQVWIGRDRVDKWWEDFAVAGEGDGDLKYDGRFGDGALLLSERHERDARVMSAGARAVPHWGWPEVLAADPLHAILATAGLPTIRPRDHAQLITLQRTLRRPTSAKAQPARENTV